MFTDGSKRHRPLKGMKSKVKLVSDRDYGFRNDDRYIEAIYRNCASLPLHPGS